MEALFGLPPEVRYCTRCTLSNQRPMSVAEHKNKSQDKVSMAFDDEGVCGACRAAEERHDPVLEQARDGELRALLDRHRSKDGSYDVVVPGSGGRDSLYVAHVLKHEYGMHPLAAHWPPFIPTAVGRRNLEAWSESGVDVVALSPNRGVHRRLARLAYLNLFYPYQPFVFGQKQVGPKVAAAHGVGLVMYGEMPASLADARNPVMKPAFFSAPADQRDAIRIGGLDRGGLLAEGFEPMDLLPYRPMDAAEVADKGIEVHYMGYYRHWKPRAILDYVETNCGFTRALERTCGSFSDYHGIDDVMDDFHFFTTFVKFGIGRCTYETAQEIRAGEMTRAEAVDLVRRYDGEFPEASLPAFLDYLDLDEETFRAVADRHRSPHLWEKAGGAWHLRSQVS